MEPTILYEDDALLVIEKPSGITVNRSDTTRNETTVQDWAEKKLKMQNAKFTVEEGNDFYNRGGIVHRLDKETSGILLIAKTPEAFIHLQSQFKERTVKKVYHALTHGHIAPKDGEIRVPVGRLPWNRKQFGIVAGGREALTKYSTIGKWKTADGEALSLVEVYPETGRTHQIRVHLKYIGHPIYADFLYGGRKTARDDRKELSRVFLHAAKIAFQHPTTGERVVFDSPLPKELQEFIDTLEKVE